MSSGEPNSPTSRRISAGGDGSMYARLGRGFRGRGGMKGPDFRERTFPCHDLCYSSRQMNSVPADVTPSGELQTLLASRVPLVIIESCEEGRVIELVRDAALKAQRGRNWGVFQW